MQMIIDQPASVPLSRRVGWGCVTLLCWALWIYLWMPLVTLAAWGLGFYQVYSEFGWRAEVMELKRLLALYLIIAAVFGSCLLSWALLEYARFRHKRRRTMPMRTEAPDLAAYTGLHAEDIAAWQKCRCLVAHHDEHGAVRDADIFHVAAATREQLNR
jgi:poly-beta-1,6-N-acetyl-D-glucosamine biosynthesis protein PgaD